MVSKIFIYEETLSSLHRKRLEINISSKFTETVNAVANITTYKSDDD